MKNKIKILTTIFLFIFFVNSAKGITGQDTLAHPFVLSDLQGTKISLEKLLSSKITVLVFWSSWEIDSINFLVKLQKYYDQYKEKGLSIIGVCSERQKLTDRQKDTLIELLKNKKISFPILLDEDLKIFSLYHIIALPTTFLINPSKKILFALHGAPLIGSQQLFRMITDTFEHEDKKHVISRIITKSPEALRYYNYADLEFKRGKIYNAKKYAERAMKIDSTFAEPLLLLAQISLEEKKYNELENKLRKLEKYSADSAQVVFLKCEYLIIQNKCDEAVEKLNSLVSAKSNNPYLHALLGYAFGMKKNTRMSEQEFSIAAKLDSLDYRIPKLKAEVYNSNGKSKEANELLHRSRQLRRIAQERF
ncbi:MAG: redoxin domain-containing protein [Bacteroidetes bacterium]|nr:redoxin domain-containing protein [Bacteroidota bacterium]